MQQYTVKIIESPNRPDAARQLRSALRNYRATEVLPNLYRAPLTPGQRFTLAHVAAEHAVDVQMSEEISISPY